MVDVRSEIFRLRQQDPPLSMAKIAQSLGITKSRVQRELQKTARGGGYPEPGDPVEAGQVIGYIPPAPAKLAQDPELAERYRALELERLELQSFELRTRRREAERRIKLLEGSGGEGSSGQLAALIVSELGHLRDDLRSSLAPKPAPPAPPPPSLVDQLAQFREMSKTMQSFAPPTAPSSGAELEFKVAMERLAVEERRISKQFEADLEERRERASAEKARNEAVARAIDTWAPVLGSAAERWLKEAPDPNRPGLPAADLRVVEGGAGGAQAANEAEVQGPCPNCGAQLALVGAEKCPACGVELEVSAGEIVARRPPDTGPPRFAS